MSGRPGVLASIRNPTPNAGTSPNAFVPLVTAEFRVFWPPLATDAEVQTAITEAYSLAIALVNERRHPTDSKAKEA